MASSKHLAMDTCISAKFFPAPIMEQIYFPANWNVMEMTRETLLPVSDHPQYISLHRKNSPLFSRHNSIM